MHLITAFVAASFSNKKIWITVILQDKEINKFLPVNMVSEQYEEQVYKNSLKTQFELLLMAPTRHDFEGSIYFTANDFHGSKHIR